MARAFSLSPQTLLRPEEKGALWFHTQSAETLFLDMQGLKTLTRLVKGERLGSFKAWAFKNFLQAKGFVVLGSRLESVQEVARVSALSQTQVSPPQALSMPEALHISLTDTCNQSCAGCFFSQQKPGVSRQNLPLSTYQNLIRQAQQYRIFQVALGGGEPLMHPQIVDMVRFAHQHQVQPNLTSNGLMLTDTLATELKQAGLRQLQLSLNGVNERSHNLTRPHFKQVHQAMDTAQKVGLRWGLNILVTRQNLTELPHILALAQTKHATCVSLIRPKAAQEDPGWLNTVSLSKAENLWLKNQLAPWQKKHSFALLLDSSFAFLAPERLSQGGHTGCSAGQRILYVRPDGQFSACGHLPYRESGQDLREIWYASEELKRFRQLPQQLEGQCQSCAFKAVCKGCRAIALSHTQSLYAEEPTCPSHQPISS